MPIIDASGFNPANPSIISCDDPDTISLLRLFRNFAVENQTEFLSKPGISEHDFDTLLTNLADPEVCGIVATGAD